MFQHFGNRLKRDLKQLVDRRLDASVMASGSVLRVRNHLHLSNPFDEQIRVLSRLESRLTSSHTNANGPYSFSLLTGQRAD